MTDHPIEDPEPTSENFELNDFELEDFQSEEELDGQQATILALMENLQTMVKQRDEAIDASLRATAELQNFKRRTVQESERTRQLATEHLVSQLLPVLDNFERTLRALESGATVDSVMEGVRGIDRQLRTALEAVNLRKIDAVGVPFDPNVHEAWGTHVDEESEENTVTHELEPGYRMGEAVLRPAKVKVSVKP